MSHYTVIYPVDDFKNIPNEEDCDKMIKECEENKEKAWNNIVALCAYNSPESKEPLTYFKELMEYYYINYENAVFKSIKASFYKEIILNKKYSESEDGKPCLMVNHYQYIHSPETGIEDAKIVIKRYKKLLLVYAMGNPSTLVNKTDNEGNALLVADALINQLDIIKELLEEFYYDLKFSELCVKYWNTHEEG